MDHIRLCIISSIFVYWLGFSIQCIQLLGNYREIIPRWISGRS